MTEQYKITRFAELRPAFGDYCRLVDEAAITEDDRAAANLLQQADTIKQALEAFMSERTGEDQAMRLDLGESMA